MSTTLLGSTMPRRMVAVLTAAMFGLTLAVNPVSAPEADASVSARLGARAVRLAARQVGVPYVWGGTNRRGFDCSGLSQYVYARLGRHIPRVAQAQYRASIKIRRGRQRPGDLVFFYRGRTIYHMGIYAGHGYMYVAPHRGARVRKQRIRGSHVLYGRVR